MAIEKCLACKGTGEQQGGPGDGAQCLQCGGAGKVRVVDVNDPGYHREKATPEPTNARYTEGWYFCWLIEKRGLHQPMWLKANDDWTLTAHDALWFARESDAETFRLTHGHAFVRIVVCEHGFMLADPLNMRTAK